MADNNLDKNGIYINRVNYSSTRNQKNYGTTGTDLGRNITLDGTGASANGVYYLANNPNLFEPQRSNNFKFVVHNLNNTITRAGMTDEEILSNSIYSVFPNAEEILTLSVMSSSVPSFSQQPIEIKRGNGTLKFAGTPSFTTGSLKLHDFIGAEMKDIMLSWQNMSYNVRTEKVGLASDYKKNANLYEYSPDGQLVRTWAIEGCWISDLKFSDFTADGGETTIDATIQYDKAYIDNSAILS